MFQSMDKTKYLVGLEHSLVPGHKRVEPLHISLFDRVHNLVVREKMLLHVLLVED